MNPAEMNLANVIGFALFLGMVGADLARRGFDYICNRINDEKWHRQEQKHLYEHIEKMAARLYNLENKKCEDSSQTSGEVAGPSPISG